MKTDFSPIRHFGSGAAPSAGGGGTPWGAIAQAGLGLIQGIVGGIKAKKAQKQLEKLQSPTYKQNDGIMKYYNEALARYGVSPSDSALYKRQQQNINRGVSTGISALQDRRSALAGTSSLLRNANDASLNAEVAAENQRNQRFGQLGGAAQMKAGEDRMAYQQNELAPFERKYNLLAAKAGANNQTVNAGISNIFGGLQNMSNMKMIDKMYANDGSGGTGSKSVETGMTPGYGGFNSPSVYGRKFRKQSQSQFGYNPQGH